MYRNFLTKEAMGRYSHTHTHILSFSAPYLSPSQVYASNILSDSLHLHWTYSEPTPTGNLVGFEIIVYFQDINFPDRINRNIRGHRQFYMTRSGGSLVQLIDFSYDLMYLLPATGYVIVIAAATNGGVGPSTSIFVTTGRTGVS